MATATVTGTVRDANQQPLVAKYVTFRVKDVGTDGLVTYPRSQVSAVTDESGQFTIDLWVNGDSAITSYYVIGLPSGERRTVVIPTGTTSITLQALLSSNQIGDPIDPPAELTLPVPVVSGGTGSTTIVGAQAGLGLRPGIDVQAYDENTAKLDVEQDWTAGQVFRLPAGTSTFFVDLFETGASTRTDTILFGAPTVEVYSSYGNLLLNDQGSRFTSNFTIQGDLSVTAGSISQSGNNVLDAADIGVTVQAFDADTAKLDVVQTFTAAQSFDTISATLSRFQGVAALSSGGLVFTNNATEPVAYFGLGGTTEAWFPDDILIGGSEDTPERTGVSILNSETPLAGEVLTYNGTAWVSSALPNNVALLDVQQEFTAPVIARNTPFRATPTSTGAPYTEYSFNSITRLDPQGFPSNETFTNTVSWEDLTGNQTLTIPNASGTIATREWVLEQLASL